MNKEVYSIQPYHVGSKQGKSLALVLPNQVVKRRNIDTSTIFVLHVDDNIPDNIILRQVNCNIKNKNMIPVEESLKRSNQQVSIRDQ